MKLHEIKVGSFIVAKNGFLSQKEGSVLLIVSREHCREDNMEDYVSYVFFNDRSLITANIGFDSNYGLNRFDMSYSGETEVFWNLL